MSYLNKSGEYYNKEMMALLESPISDLNLNDVRQHIDGIDLSPEMLDKARALGVYKSLSEGDLSADLEIPQIYQAVICVGVFSHKPEQPDQAARLLDCLLPGGLLVATVNGKGWDDLDWDTLLEGSRRRHGFSIDSLEDIPYLVKQGIRGKLLVLKP